MQSCVHVPPDDEDDVAAPDVAAPAIGMPSMQVPALTSAPKFQSAIRAAAGAVARGEKLAAPWREVVAATPSRAPRRRNPGKSR
jgi:hypothetical protein